VCKVLFQVRALPDFSLLDKWILFHTKWSHSLLFCVCPVTGWIGLW
jgi:hypothetical protein